MGATESRKRRPVIAIRPRATPIARHYGLDWLRIGAFLLLIVYHIGLFLSPWDWHANTETPVEWMPYLLMALNPWRMLLLFLVSGYAARAVLSRAGGMQGFVRSRCVRLLVPLVFGVCVIVTPQPWVEVQAKLGYPHGYGYFMIHDYFDFDDSDHIITPNLFHLWFVAYIWAYSMIVAVGAALLPDRLIAMIERRLEWIFTGWRLIVLPVLWLLLVREVIAPAAHPTNRLIDDIPGHLIYLPAFLFGFVLARMPRAWPSILRAWPAALSLVVIGYGATIWQLHGYPGLPHLSRDHRGELAWASLVGWGAILLLLGMAQRWLNHDHPVRATLNEAVFPIYIIHQTLIVVIAWSILPLHLGAGLESAILFPTTILGCWAFYAIGRRIGWLRPLIGLGPVARPAGTAGHRSKGVADVRYHAALDARDSRWIGVNGADEALTR